MRERYHRTWQGVVRSKKWPESWKHWLVNMIEKRGKDPTSSYFKNQHDIWMVCQGWKLLTGCGEMEYKRVMEQVIPAYASGFRRWHGPADDTI
eukprot:493136-Prymnesium_polylepis.1